MDDSGCEKVIPLVEERISARKEEVETGRVRVRTVMNETNFVVREELERDNVEIQRVPIDREIDQVPDIRNEDGVLIIPVVEEILVIEKRLMLREEIHLRRRTISEHFEQAVPLKSQQAIIERQQFDGDCSSSKPKE